MEINVNSCDLIIKECTSKSGKKYNALFLVYNDVEVFITFVNDFTFDKLK